MTSKVRGIFRPTKQSMITRIVFLKTSSPSTFTAFLTYATARRCSFATGGTFSNSRASLQFTATLTTMLLTRDDTTGCFYMSTCSIVMSVHMTHQYFSECRAVKYPRLVTKKRHEMCFYAFIDCHLQWTTAVAMLPVLPMIANIRGCTCTTIIVMCHVNNTVLCILLSRSNDERTCIYARCIGTISGHKGTDRTRGRKQVVKSSEPNVDAGEESKLPLNQNHISCLFKWKVKLDSDAIPSTFLEMFRC